MNIHIKVISFVFLILFAGCATSKLSMTPICNIDYANELADNALKRKKFKLEEYKRETTDSESAFVIIYSLKESYSLGGGAELKISKADCSIIGFELYQ